MPNICVMDPTTAHLPIVLFSLFMKSVYLESLVYKLLEIHVQLAWLEQM